MNPPEPIHVFISSDEDEFSDFRERLKAILEKVQVVSSKKAGEQVTGPAESRYYQPLIVPEVAEYWRGGNIERKMRTIMNRSHLYVGLFGKEFSRRTTKEFSGAIDRGMTTIVYYFAGPTQALKALSGSGDKVYEFLMEEVYPKTFIRGNCGRIQIKSLAELEDEIVLDIVAELTSMIRQYHAVQKAISGFQSES